MPITPDDVGRTYPTTDPYLVTAEKIRELATALGDTAPAYRGDDPIAPPTFAMVLASRAWEALFDDERLGLQLEHMIHTDQSFNWIRPLHKGDEVTSTLTITSVRTRGNTDIIGIDVSLDHVNGEHLGNATSTLWHTRPGIDA
ncbi:MaoC family dehydratase N-terminal domain-containing protein [Cutibacterium sp.]|uniref:FAS1-like dehydratase domain-containing protein n=1 Tax=Cutibacterium sp. TaxID=1912221 RepID=UPI0026DB1098|nr:MaoC family dehydratase N-terminal domain-containing protein [Cutibacterium sp.]MDO4413426.1 MaoC family dehydratase N-terminal domain-containing protein [Cutibacterium sp.]